MTLDAVIGEYVALGQAMGYAFTTHRAVLQSFGRAMGRDLALSAVAPERVRVFLGPPTTCNWHHKASILRGFYRYAVSRGHVPTSPLPPLAPKLPPPFVPYVYTQEEIRRLLEATTSYRTIHRLLEPHTFRALLLVLYGAGLRISEALAFRLADVDFAQAVLVVRATKFYKARLVPMGTQLHTALAHYATARRTAGHAERPDTPFFVGRTGHPLTIPTVQQAFRRLRAHAGIRRPGGARHQPRLHDLRHAAAVHRLVAWYRAGADGTRLLPKLSTYLGHLGLSSTQRYLTMTPALLQAAGTRFEQYAMRGGSDA